MAYIFGTGLLTLTPAGANPTPIQVAVLKDVALDFSFTTKELRGEKQFAMDIARGAAKLTAKAKSGNINGGLINALLSGSTSSTGSVQGVHGQDAAIPSTPFTVTVTNGANFKSDFGVLNKTTGKWMTRVASAPATGQYSVNTTSGVYTFAAADTGNTVTIFYSWTDSATGKTTALTNQLMGAGTTFQLDLFNSFRSKSQGFHLYAVTSTKLAMALKSEDYLETDMDFECFADDLGRVVDVYTAD